MENDKIHDYTDAYLESYLRALDKTHNPDLAIQTAMGVTMVLRTIDAQNEPKQPGQMLQERKIEHEQHDLYDGYQIIVPLPEPTKEITVIEHQCSYGSIMNLLEIWADGSIQGYLSAKQTLKIIERVKARESPR